MCLTIPGKIESIEDGIAIVESGRETTSIDLSLVLNAKPGDWILYATNRAVKLISEQDAREIIALLSDNYSPVDIKKLPLRFKKIIYKIRSQQPDYSSSPVEDRVEKSESDSSRQARTIRKPILSKEEIVYLLNLKGRDNLETLYAEANFLRKDRIKDFICIHGIIEFSNYCKNNCLYCGIRHDSAIERYRMSKDEIVKAAERAVNKNGYKLLVLQSGEDYSYSDNDLIDLIREIKNKMRVFIFLSVGVRSKEFYKKAFHAGVTGSLLRFETSSEELFQKIKPDQGFGERFQSVKDQMKIGYYMATGSLFGLPGQTLEMIADDLLTLQKLNPPMVSSGPYIGAKNTPLQISKSKFLISNQIPNPSFESEPEGSSLRVEDKSQIQNLSQKALLELTLKYIAITRFLMPEAKIPVTTALETLDKEGRHKGLLAGANSLMFNLTPNKYRKKYKIYDNKFKDNEKIWQKYGLFKDEESWEMLEEKMRLK